MAEGKWILNIADSYTIGGKTITRTEDIVIPPTSGDRIDIIGESRKYYYNMTKEEFMERMTPEEYLSKNLKGLTAEEYEKALKDIDWTPRKINDSISIIIEIKGGEVTIKTK